MALALIFLTTIIVVVLRPMIQNYIIARKIGLPILITPLGLLNPIWQIGEHYITPALRSIPFGLGSFVEYSSLVSLFHDKYKRHAKLGDAYTVVSPTEVIVVICDAGASEDILNRRKDFIKSPLMYKPLELFGRNVDTLNGEDWQRHRRLTTPPFNEKNSNIVWKETLSQASQMLESWMREDRQGHVNTTEEDTSTLTLHVLMAAGFGKTCEFDAKPSEGRQSHRDALHIVLRDIFLSFVMGSVPLPSAILPKKALEVKNAITEFKQYMVEMVDDERIALGHTETQDNLMSVLVRSAEQGKIQQSRSSMTDEEIYGNLFIFNMAGHDTTSGIISDCILMLAAHPDLQDWISEEINLVLPDNNHGNWDYTSAFPKLRRCLAVMYECLRLIGAVPFIPKNTGDSPQTVNVGGRDIHMPPNTFIYLQLVGLHNRTDYWGDDSSSWRPSRWISDDQDEGLIEPPAGRFFPWSGGPRICPGKKFSQVEVVAAIAYLFRGHTVRPVPEAGETRDEACKRFFKNAMDDFGLVMTIRPKHPEKNRLIWERRT